VNIRQSGTSLIAWEGDEPVASVVWERDEAGWYINFLHTERPGLVSELFKQFRPVWRAAGCPALAFNKASQAGIFRRFVARTNLKENTNA
jgi:hypothetical protein